MNKLQKHNNSYPVTQDLSFVRDIVESEPKREFSFLSNIFSRRTVNNFVRIRVYNHCVFTFKNSDEREED